MLIYVIPSSFPNRINPQASIFVLEQCKALQNLGHSIVVLDATTKNWRYWLHEDCKGIKHSSIDSVDIYSWHIRGGLKNKLPRFAVKQFMHKIYKIYDYAVKKHGKPDIIYSHFSFPSGYVSCKLGEKNNIPVVVNEHGGMFMKESIHRYVQRILTYTINNATDFFCVSEAHKDAINKWSGLNKGIKIVPNMIDDRFRYYTNVKTKQFQFFSAGNLFYVKRFDLLIDAFINSFKSDDEVTLKIAGNGIEYTKLRDLIVKNKREHQIFLTGRLDRQEMLQAYIECDCFVLPSNYESFGIVYREAMAVGRPVIATKNGGIEDNWQNKFGILVSKNNLDELSQAMIYMKNNYNIYNNKYISDTCINSYSSSKIVKRINNILEKAIKKQRGNIS